MRVGGLVGAVGLGGVSVFLSVGHFHRPGETLHAEDMYTEPGGKAYNQAVAAARLGASALFIGAVGADAGGKSCRELLEREGVAHRLLVSADAGTAYACILTDASGDNRVTVYGGAANSLSPEFIRSCREDIAKCSVLLLGLECPPEATVAALELAEELGVYTILNPAPARPLDRALLRRFDLITPNAQEAALLFGAEGADAAELCAAMRRFGVRRAVVTLGGDGALLFSGDRGLRYPAIVSEAVDTTGAGDCFNGALAAALAGGRELSQAVAFAVNASALSVRRPHVMTALPTAREVAGAYTELRPWELQGP